MAPINLPPPLTIALVVILLAQVPASSSKPESEILLDFRNSLANETALSSWKNASVAPCSGGKANWIGVLCEEGRVWGLKLENMGLSGAIDVESLKELPALRTISLMNNDLDGGLPSLNKLSSLKTVYLSNNKFSGEIEGGAFDGMKSLKKIHLENNQFGGVIPVSLTKLPKLVELDLKGNRFEGNVPDFPPGRLRLLDLSNNELKGPIPASLSTMNASSFSGNKDLCGPPLQPCPSTSTSKQPLKTILIAVIAAVLALAIVAAIFIIILCRRRKTSQTTTEASAPVVLHERAASGDANKSAQLQALPENSSTTKQKAELNSGKLTFLREDREKFDLADLLRASAEVLGSGYLGSAYKAALMTGKRMVVKRFRDMNNVDREEFQEHMRRLGRLRHPNLVPLVAFYYRKEEKLLVSDYVDNVSLAVHLHGNHSRGQPSPNWPTRLKIIKGVAKGLLHLYNELPSLILPHGHLKSSNVLLNESFEPLLSDYGLVPVVNQEHAQEVLVAYKSPEYRQQNRVTKKTDVWSFGVLILEILTGKFPANCIQQGKGSDTDLVTWVYQISVTAREDRTADLFDKDMGATTEKNEAEMIKLLKIGLACAEADVEKRWDLKEAIQKIEELNENDT
ncbi:actin-regulating kinase prk1 [Sarracenia purpurea var. burkii]